MNFPSTKTHYLITQKFLGKAHEDIHALIDGSVSIKRSELSKKTDLIDKSSHRKDFVHDVDFWNILFIMGKIDREQLMAAYLHFLSDRIDTETKHGLDKLYNPDFEKQRYKAKLLGK